MSPCIVRTLQTSTSRSGAWGRHSFGGVKAPCLIRGGMPCASAIQRAGDREASQYLVRIYLGSNAGASPRSGRFDAGPTAPRHPSGASGETTWWPVHTGMWDDAVPVWVYEVLGRTAGAHRSRSVVRIAGPLSASTSATPRCIAFIRCMRQDSWVLSLDTVAGGLRYSKAFGLRALSVGRRRAREDSRKSPNHGTDVADGWKRTPSRHRNDTDTDIPPPPTSTGRGRDT